jgi:hypothetical protein
MTYTNMKGVGHLSAEKRAELRAQRAAQRKLADDLKKAAGPVAKPAPKKSAE